MVEIKIKDSFPASILGILGETLYICTQNSHVNTNIL